MLKSLPTACHRGERDHLPSEGVREQLGTLECVGSLIWYLRGTYFVLGLRTPQ